MLGSTLFDWLAETGARKVAHAEQIGNARPVFASCVGRDAKARGDGDVRVGLSLRPAYWLWEAPEDTPFSTAVRNELARGSLPLKSSAIALLCRSHLTVRAAVTELGNLRQWK